MATRPRAGTPSSGADRHRHEPRADRDPYPDRLPGQAPQAPCRDRQPRSGPAVTFGCKVLQTGGRQLEFNVTTTGGGSYAGTVYVSYYDYPGSGHIFPSTTVQGATPVGSWQPVPAADIGASAEPSGCSASAR